MDPLTSIGSDFLRLWQKKVALGASLSFVKVELKQNGALVMHEYHVQCPLFMCKR